MGFQLDHIFILVSEGAPEADQLVRFGLREGQSNTHTGQGTANRLFFFHNFMLEFLWVHDLQKAKTNGPDLLWERWVKRDKYSPFGIGIRPDENQYGKLPFQYWEYSPDYLPPDTSMQISKSSKNLNEPLIFILPAQSHAIRSESISSINHPKGFKKLTSVNVQFPLPENTSDALRFVLGLKNISVEKSDNHNLELGFDNESEEKSENFNPALPLLLKW